MASPAAAAISNSPPIRPSTGVVVISEQQKEKEFKEKEEKKGKKLELVSASPAASAMAMSTSSVPAAATSRASLLASYTQTAIVAVPEHKLSRASYELSEEDLARMEFDELPCEFCHKLFAVESLESHQFKCSRTLTVPARDPLLQANSTKKQHQKTLTEKTSVETKVAAKLISANDGFQTIGGRLSKRKQKLKQKRHGSGEAEGRTSRQGGVAV